MVVSIDLSAIHQNVLQTVKQENERRTILAANAMKKAANTVLSNKGGRGGKTYRKPNTKRATYTASAPGEVPALRSGDLRRRFHPLPRGQMIGGGMTYTPGIRTTVIYAPMLEHGTSKMAARPFEEKIKQEAQPEVQQIFGQPYF